MCSFIAQLVEHRTGIAEASGSNPVEALIISNCLNWKSYCADHSSVLSTTAVQIYEYFIYTSHRLSIFLTSKHYFVFPSIPDI